MKPVVVHLIESKQPYNNQCYNLQAAMLNVKK